MTTAARLIEKMAVEGYLLLANETEAFLVSAPYQDTTRPDIPIPLPVALDAIRGVGTERFHTIAPLSQFRWRYKVGWREWVGARGEKFDVFCMVQ